MKKLDEMTVTNKDQKTTSDVVTTASATATAATQPKKLKDIPELRTFWPPTVDLNATVNDPVDFGLLPPCKILPLYFAKYLTPANTTVSESLCRHGASHVVLNNWIATTTANNNEFMSVLEKFSKDIECEPVITETTIGPSNVIAQSKKLKDIPGIAMYFSGEQLNADINEPIVQFEGNAIAFSVLEWAATHTTLDVKGWEAIVAAALENGADPDALRVVVSSAGMMSYTAFMMAARHAPHEIVNLFVSHNSDFTMRDMDGNTALDYAGSTTHIKGRIQALNFDFFRLDSTYGSSRYDQMKGALPLLAKIHEMLFDWETPPSKAITNLVREAIEDKHSGFTQDLAKIVAHYAQGPSVEEISGLLAKETPGRFALFKLYCRTAHEKYNAKYKNKNAGSMASVNAVATATTSTNASY